MNAIECPKMIYFIMKNVLIIHFNFKLMDLATAKKNHCPEIELSVSMNWQSYR